MVQQRPRRAYFRSAVGPTWLTATGIKPEAIMKDRKALQVPRPLGGATADRCCRGVKNKQEEVKAAGPQRSRSFQMRLGRELTPGDHQALQLAGPEGHDPADEITELELGAKRPRPGDQVDKIFKTYIDGGKGRRGRVRQQPAGPVDRVRTTTPAYANGLLTPDRHGSSRRRSPRRISPREAEPRDRTMGEDQPSVPGLRLHSAGARTRSTVACRPVPWCPAPTPRPVRPSNSASTGEPWGGQSWMPAGAGASHPPSLGPAQGAGQGVPLPRHACRHSTPRVVRSCGIGPTMWQAHCGRAAVDRRRSILLGIGGEQVSAAWLGRNAVAQSGAGAPAEPAIRRGERSSIEGHPDRPRGTEQPDRLSSAWWIGKYIKRNCSFQASVSEPNGLTVQQRQQVPAVHGNAQPASSTAKLGLPQQVRSRSRRPEVALGTQFLDEELDFCAKCREVGDGRRHLRRSRLRPVSPEAAARLTPPMRRQGFSRPSKSSPWMPSKRSAKGCRRRVP